MYAILRPSGLKLGDDVGLPLPTVTRRGWSLPNGDTAYRSVPSSPAEKTSVLPSGEKAGVMLVPPSEGTRRACPVTRSRTTMCVPSSAMAAYATYRAVGCHAGDKAT